MGQLNISHWSFEYQSLISWISVISIISELKKSFQQSDWSSGSLYNILEAWLLSLPHLPSRQVNLAGSCEWIFRLFGRHHGNFRIFERMENFQNDCCRPWTKKPFKNSYSRQLRIVNAVVSWSAQQVRSTDGNLFFSKLKLLILRHWWQLWMKSTEIKQRYRINFFRNVSLVCFTAQNSMSKLIHNQCTCKLIIKTLRLHTCMQTNNCVFVFMF